MVKRRATILLVFLLLLPVAVSAESSTIELAPAERYSLSRTNGPAPH